MKTRHFFTIVLLVGVSLLTLLVPGEGKPSVALAARASVPAPRAMDVSQRDAAADSNVVYVCSSSHIGRTNDISAQSPHWTNITPPAVGALHDCVPDPWKPQEKMWAVSTSGIWKGENLNTATPLWTHLQTTDQIRSDTDGHTGNGSEPDRIIPSMRIPGAVFVLYSHGGLGGAAKTWVGRSTDDGITWSWNKVADDGSQARDFGFAIWQNANSPDAVTVWASPVRGQLYTSTDGGQTFRQNLQLPASDFYQIHAMYAPVSDTVGSVLYVGGGSGSQETAYIYKTVDGGVSWSYSIAPVGGDGQRRGPLRQYEIAGPPSSSTHLYALVQRPQDVVGENKKLYYSADGGESWTLRFDFAAWTFDVLGIGLNAIDENRLYVLRQNLSGAVSNTLIYSSNDGGTTWDDKSGNWKANVGNWSGAVAVWDAAVTPIESPLPGSLASLDLMASPVYADNQPIILSRRIHNLANAPKTYTFRVSLLQDGNVVEAKPDEQVNIWGSMTDERTNISFGMRPMGRYEIRAELKLGADVIDNASLSVHVLSAGQQEAYLTAGGLKYFAMAELGQIGDIVTDRYVYALTAAADEGAGLVISVITGPYIKSLSPVGHAAGLSDRDIAKATFEIGKETTTITTWLSDPVENLSEGFVRPHVEERLTPQVEAINARQEAFNAFVASRGPLTWTVDMSAWALTYASYISSRVEEEPISLVQLGSDVAITTTLWGANQQFDWMATVGEVAGWVVVGLSVLILIVAVLGLTPETLGGAIALFVAAIPTLITVLSAIKAAFGAILPLILVMTMLSHAAKTVAPAVRDQHNGGLDTLTTLISQSTGTSVEALHTESSVKDGQVALTTQLRNANTTPAQPVVETYLYEVDGSIVKILSRQPVISAGGTETMRETVSLPPGRYKAVTSVHTREQIGLASQVSPFEIPGPAVLLGIALSPSQLSLGQPVHASIDVVNRDASSGTGNLVVVAQSSDGQNVKGWLVNLDPGASQHLEYSFAPQAVGSYRLRVSISDGANLLAVHDSAYLVGDGAALAVNIAAQTVYSPSLAVTLPLTVTNAGNLPGSTTLSLTTYDQASAAGPIYTATLPVNVGAGASLAASLTALPVELSQPGSYTALLYLGDEPYTSLDFAVAAQDTLFAGIAPDKPFHHVGDTIPLTVTVLNSAFAYADASVQVSLWRPDGVTQTVAMQAAGIGQYLGQVTAPISGTYVATVQVFKPEYRLVGSQAVFIVEESSQLQASVDGLAIQGQTRPVTLTVSNGNGIPIAGAQVVISGTSEYLSRVTNETGQAVIQLSPATTDTYRVELEKPGFATTLMGLPVWWVLDVTPPDLVFLTPSITRQSPYTVTGQTEAGSHLTVNGQAVTVDAQGFFTTTAALTEGPNLLAGTAADAAGNPTTVTYTVTLDTVPPSLSVPSPADGLVTTQDVIQVTGSTEAGARVIVNGILAPVDPGSGAFSAWVLLKPWANTISIAATDHAENTTTVSRAVTLVGKVYLPIVMK